MARSRMTATEKARRDTHRRYDEACSRLRLVFPDPSLTTIPMDVIAEQVTGALRGMGGAAWQMLDERDGYRDLGSNLFALVRQTRNHPQHGPALIRAANSEGR